MDKEKKKESLSFLLAAGSKIYGEKGADRNVSGTRGT